MLEIDSHLESAVISPDCGKFPVHERECLASVTPGPLLNCASKHHECAFITPCNFKGSV